MILFIRINKNDIVFIDLFKKDSNIPILSRICITQDQINKAMLEINNMNIKYELKYTKI